ncbi:MAG: bifunctional metallophosphatase/5'-nucleotidase [candidate division Zixibacteria bacterium]|nr:bifunctional metallophosphatase/5'-nucleotidase [candidate division Zixibacteria bacterium]
MTLPPLLTLDLKMRFSTVLFFVAAWQALLGPPVLPVAAQSPSNADTVAVSILHSNDVSGRLVRRATAEGQIGGMAARVRLIREIAAAEPVVALDAGSAIGPDPLSASDSGKTMIDLMRLAGYQAMLPANHEFNYGLDHLRLLQEKGGFPLLAANIQSPDSLIRPFVVVDVGGPRIAVIGLVAPEVATLTNPRRVANLVFNDPQTTAVQTLKTLPPDVDYVILLVHMREAEAIKLAQQTPGIDLIVAGGYYSVGQPDEVPTAIHLGSGIRIVATPGGGERLGRVTLRFARRPDGRYEAVSVVESQTPIDTSLTDEPEADRLIARLERSYRSAVAETLGHIHVDTPQEQPLLIAYLMRNRTSAEIGIVNRGALEPIATDRPLVQGDVDRLVRFPDRLVTLRLTGAQVRALMTRNTLIDRNSAQLVFAGLDLKTATVQGRPLRDAESYRIVTTEFLANGGDDHRTFVQGRSTVLTGIELRALVASAIRENGPLILGILSREAPPRSWFAGWELEGAFERNFVDATTDRYRKQNEQVAFLSGATTFAWNGAARFYLACQPGAHELRLDQSMDFGQIGRNLDNLTTSTDQVTTELKYRYLTPHVGFNPFVSVGSNTAFTRGASQRPILVRSSLGFQQQVFGKLLIGFAGRSQRDFVVDVSDFGTEMTAELNHTLKTGARFRVQVRSFVGFTDRRVVSVENYNTLNVPLTGALRLNIRQSNFVYRVNRIRGVPVSGVAFRTNLNIGFGYGLDWKWL